MKTKQLRSTKTIASALFAAALFAGSSSVFAQVKIGSNPTTISPNSNLEVEAGNGSKTVIQKDNGRVGVNTSTPVGQLHVVGSGGNTLYLEGLNPVTGPYSQLGVNNTTGQVGTVTPGAPPVFVTRNSYDSYGTATRLNVELTQPSGTGAFTPNIPINTMGASIVNDATNGDYIILPNAGTYRVDVQVIANRATATVPLGFNIGLKGQPSTGGTVTDLLASLAATLATGNNYPGFASRVILAPSANYRVRLYVETVAPYTINPGCAGAGQDFCTQVIVTQL